MAKNGYFVLVMGGNKQHSGKKWGYIFKIFKQHLSLTWKKSIAYMKKVCSPFKAQIDNFSYSHSEELRGIA